jgi:hypothetical protein
MLKALMTRTRQWYWTSGGTLRTVRHSEVEPISNCGPALNAQARALVMRLLVFLFVFAYHSEGLRHGLRVRGEYAAWFPQKPDRRKT